MNSADKDDSQKSKGFDPSKTGAWTAFAIGAVTKRVSIEKAEQEKHSDKS